MRRFNNNSGFSLVELSIVLVIIGLLVGLGSSMIGPMMNFTKVRETRDMMDAALQSIIGSASSSNSIASDTTFPTIAKASMDAWGRSFIYLYDVNLYSATPTKDTICGRRSTTLTLVTTDPAATISNVAFALFSAADNTAFKSSLNGTYKGAITNALITASGAATGTVTVTGPNSDLVRWVTLDELRGKIGCQGAPLKILNNELPSGSASSYLDTMVYADGGVPDLGVSGKYWWCVQNTTGAAPTGLTFKGVVGGVTGADIQFHTDCRSIVANTSVPLWSQADMINIQRNATITAGSNGLTIYVRDINAPSDATRLMNNIASKPFVITINP
jgi:prepilin-type N-terminal cleavage/methylation domain-containing protein